MESDEREWEGQWGAVEPGRDSATAATENAVNDAIIVEVGGEEVGIRPQGGQRSIRRRGNGAKSPRSRHGRSQTSGKRRGGG
jgi:hypothetical protein